MTDLDDLIGRWPETDQLKFMEFLERMKKKGYVQEDSKIGLSEEFAKVVLFGEFIGGVFPKNYLGRSRN